MDSLLELLSFGTTKNSVQNNSDFGTAHYSPGDRIGVRWDNVYTVAEYTGQGSTNKTKQHLIQKFCTAKQGIIIFYSY